MRQFKAMLASAMTVAFVQCGSGPTGSALPETLQLSASVQGPSEVQLSWTAAAADTAGYRLRRNGATVSSLLLDDTRFADSNLDAETRYCYRVTAVAADGAETDTSAEQCVTTPATAGWPLQTLANTAGEGAFAALALDSADFRHVSFRGSDGVDYATDSTGSWREYAIDPSAGASGDTAIGVDSFGHVHIAYYDVGRDRLMYATNRSGRWVRQLVRVGAGRVNALAVDPGGRVALAYSSASPANSLWLVTVIGGVLGTPQEVDAYAVPVADLAVAVDTSGLVHLGAALGSTACEIRHLVQAGTSTWTQTPVQADAACGVALTLVGGNTPTLAYMAGTQLRVASAADAWAPELAASLAQPGGARLGLAADAGQVLHLSYQDYNLDLIYASNPGASWQQQVLDADGNVGADSALAVDSGGGVHIVYDDRSNAALKYTSGP